MAFEPENQLERSLTKAAADPTQMTQFYKDLVDSDIYVIQEGPAPASPGRTTLKEGEELRVGFFEVDGKTFIPIFSSLQRLQDVVSNQAGYISINALEFMKLTQGADLFLNQMSQYSKAFSKEEIAAIIDGSIWSRIDSIVATEQLANQPKRGLLDKLSGLFQKRN